MMDSPHHPDTHTDFRHDVLRLLLDIEDGLVRLLPARTDQFSIVWHTEHGWAITVFFDGQWPSAWDYVEAVEAPDGWKWESFRDGCVQDWPELALENYRLDTKAVRRCYPILEGHYE